MKPIRSLITSLLIVCATLATVISVNAQQCTWARQAGGSMDALPKTIITDAAGNVYTAGNFDSDTLYFGTSFVVNSAIFNNNIFVAKYDSSGNFIWAKQFGGKNSDQVSGMTIDAAGNIYITGQLTSDSVSFGTTTLANPYAQSIFLVRLDTAGNVGWAKSVATGPGYELLVDGITTDAAGNIFITGSFPDSLYLGSTILVHTLEGNGIFVAKYDALGNYLWANNSNGAGDDEPAAIAVDAADNVYVTGSWTSTSITFDSLTLINAAYDNNLFFLVKYNASGMAEWAKSYGDSNFVGGASLGIDAGGDIYVTGYFSSPSLTIGSTTFTNNDITGNSDDIFLAKYNATGSLLWAKTFGGDNEDMVHSLVVDPATGSTYLAGMFFSSSIAFGTMPLSNPGIFLAQFNSSGNVLWAKGNDAISSAAVTGICKDAFGHLFATGFFNTPALSLDGLSLSDPASPFTEMFVAKYINIATGISLLASPAFINIYPDPATDYIIVSSDNLITSIAVTDLSGKTEYSQKCNTLNANIHVSGLPSGMHLIRINDSMVRKFVKE